MKRNQCRKFAAIRFKRSTFGNKAKYVRLTSGLYGFKFFNNTKLLNIADEEDIACESTELNKRMAKRLKTKNLHRIAK